MTEIKIKEVNCETGEEIVRNATAEEIVKIEEKREAWAVEQTYIEAQATAKADLLTKLGITAEEAKLLLS